MPQKEPETTPGRVTEDKSRPQAVHVTPTSPSRSKETKAWSITVPLDLVTEWGTLMGHGGHWGHADLDDPGDSQCDTGKARVCMHM